jgi:hypothetical protein
MHSIHVALLAMWGFVLGFVGWPACFRLVQSISTWLIGARPNALLLTITQFVVLIFLITSNFVALSLMPLFLGVVGHQHSAHDIEWRDAARITFISSLIGLTCLGIVLRLGRSNR